VAPLSPPEQFCPETASVDRDGSNGLCFAPHFREFAPFISRTGLFPFKSLSQKKPASRIANHYLLLNKSCFQKFTSELYEVQLLKGN